MPDSIMSTGPMAAIPILELLRLRGKQSKKPANTVTTGNIVTVRPGPYAEHVKVTTSGSRGSLITFQADANGTVVMQGFKILADYIRVQGFEITNGPVHCNYCRFSISFSKVFTVTISPRFMASRCLHSRRKRLLSFGASQIVNKFSYR